MDREMQTQLRIGLRERHGEEDQGGQAHLSIVHMSGVARTWRWKDSLGGRFGAKHGDTDFLESYNLFILPAKKEKAKKGMRAGARVDFMYMKEGVEEEVYTNQIMTSIVQYIQGTLGLLFMLVLVPQIFFQETKQQTFRYFRFNIFGLGKKAVPLEELPESERKKEELKRAEDAKKDEEVTGVPVVHEADDDISA